MGIIVSSSLVCDLLEGWMGYPPTPNYLSLLFSIQHSAWHTKTTYESLNKESSGNSGEAHLPMPGA